MFRLIILLTSALGFSRDYLFPSESLIELILSVFIVDACSEILTKAFSSRALNSKPSQSIYYRNPTSKNLILILSLASFLLACILIFSFRNSNNISTWILLALPAATIYRFVSLSSLLLQKYRTYYFIDLLKNLGIFICFFFSSDFGILANSCIFAAISLLIWNRNFSKFGSNKSYSNAVIIYFKRDIWIVIQSIFVMSSYFIDKTFLPEHHNPLLYLLITKFVLFSIGIFNSMFLLKSHIELVDSKQKDPLKALLRENFQYILIFIAGYMVLFLYLIENLPIKNQISLSNTQIFLGAAWLSLMLIRELYIRALSIKGLIPTIGKYMTLYGIVIFFLSIQIGSVGIQAMIAAYIAANFIVTLGFHRAYAAAN